MKSFKRANSLVFATLLLLTLARPAHAYVDGGSAAMLFQMAIAGFLAFIYMLVRWWASVVKAVKTGAHYFTGKRATPQEESNSGQ